MYGGYYERNPNGLGAAEEPETATIDGQPVTVTPGEQIVEYDDWMVPVAAAQQIFGMFPSIAAGLAGIILAWRLTQSRTIAIKGTEVIAAVVLSSIPSFFALFLMKTFRTYEE